MAFECSSKLPRVDVPGAFIQAGKATFCIWAPEKSTIEVLLGADATSQAISLERQENGYFTLTVPSLPVGTLYKYRVDGEGTYPDPCSRFQPDGPHGASMLIERDAYRWHDAQWTGAQLRGQVIYELHVGTFTAAGTFDAAIDKLQHLQQLGITAIEILPIAECPGRRNWGYDGVQLFAPYHVYGDYEGLKRLVDAAHQRGIAVVLDVVYNHLGPDGNYLKCFSSSYFSNRHTDWGEALNFDGHHSRGTRDLVIANASYWIDEFHLDGLRLDAIQSIFDDSAVHIVADIVRYAREAAAPRRIFVVAENERQRAEQFLPLDQGGFDLDGMWNDDFHHAARVALTGSRDGYFNDYAGRSQEFISAAKHGFLYQGQYYYWQQQARGSPMRSVPAWSCVHFLQNHDQVANTYLGERLHALVAPARYRACTALLLLGPQTPLLFMGQEFSASNRFMFFADHGNELRAAVHSGRREFLRQFRAYANETVQAAIVDPSSDAAFLGSKLRWEELEQNQAALALHRDLLALRRDDPVISQQRVEMFDGATLSEHAFVLRWFDVTHGDRLLVVNLDGEQVIQPAPEPLLAPPLDQKWAMQWSSEEVRYGGHGTVSPVSTDQRWRVQANCAVLLHATASTTEPSLS